MAGRPLGHYIIIIVRGIERKAIFGDAFGQEVFLGSIRWDFF
jgi:hypothetical protein